MSLPPTYLVAAVLVGQIAKLPDRRLRVSDAYRTVAEELKLGDQDTSEFYPSGDNRWHITVRSAGESLKRNGLLLRHPSAGRGWYELSDEVGPSAVSLLDELDEF